MRETVHTGVGAGAPYGEPTQLEGVHLTAARAILYGTLMVGVIDGIDAIVFGAIRGAGPLRVFQGIAFSLLGRATYGYGVASALLGVLLHFSVACGIVSVYFIVSRWLRPLRQRPIVFGPLYGIVAYFVMNLVVLPMTAIGHVRFSTPSVVNGILIHMFGIGLPAAWFAARARMQDAA
jgi:hypothetical protein